MVSEKQISQQFLTRRYGHEFKVPIFRLFHFESSVVESRDRPEFCRGKTVNLSNSAASAFSGMMAVLLGLTQIGSGKLITGSSLFRIQNTYATDSSKTACNASFRLAYQWHLLPEGLGL
jgi:hypothetical protein